MLQRYNFIYNFCPISQNFFILLTEFNISKDYLLGFALDV